MPARTMWKIYRFATEVPPPYPPQPFLEQWCYAASLRVAPGLMHRFCTAQCFVGHCQNAKHEFDGDLVTDKGSI